MGGMALLTEAHGSSPLTMNLNRSFDFVCRGPA